MTSPDRARPGLLRLATALAALLLCCALVAAARAQAPAAPPGAGALPSGPPTPELGRELFRKLGCAVCHAVVKAGGPTGGPRLYRSFGRVQRLTGGRRVRVDERYLRESILRPGAQVVAGYQGKPMPPFERVLDEQQVRALVLYIRSLK